jgi:hypothetical protein
LLHRSQIEGVSLGDPSVLHYYLDTREEPLGWTDVEALPFYLFGAGVVVALVYVWMHLETETETALFKVAMIFGILGLRYMLGGREPNAARSAETTT